MKNKKLKPLNYKIQVCPNCGKVDVYKNDGHDCVSWHENQAMNDNQ